MPDPLTAEQLADWWRQEAQSHDDAFGPDGEYAKYMRRTADLIEAQAATLADIRFVVEGNPNASADEILPEIVHILDGEASDA